MKRVGIDARLYFQTGVGVYLRNLLHYLQEFDTSNLEFFVYVMNEDAGKIHFKKSNFIKRSVSYYWHSLAEQINFLSKLYSDQLNLMHFTYFSYPIFYRKKFIATVHDTIPLNYKTGKASTRSTIAYEIKHQAARLAYASQIKNAQVVVTPSVTIKNELIKTFGDRRSSKITPIYEGVNYEYFDQKADIALQKSFKKHDFFMYIGNFYPHKNIERLIQAFSQINSSKKLLLIGAEDYFRYKLQKLTVSLGFTDKIIFYKPKNINEIIFFYKNALALVHPSLAEGFCLPLLEAAYFKLPIIGSDIPIFREIIGDTYLKFDPSDTRSMQTALSSFLKQKNHTVSTIDKNYSFENMSKRILNLYQTI